MHTSVLYTLLSWSSLLSVGVVVGVEAPLEAASAPKTCPWDPPIRNLRVPACASPDFIRGLLAPSSSSSPFAEWRGPEQCVNGTCVFSNTARGDGGISLITSPRHARVILDYNFDNGGAYPPPFRTEEMTTLGKGIGLLANRSIVRGEVLMVRTPTLIAQREGLDGLEARARDRLYDIAISRLPKDGRDAFMAQMGRDVHDKIDINSFELFVHGADDGGKGRAHLACYPEVARMNHDCRPNVHYRIANATITALAARDIQAGEELTVSYVDVFLPSKQRKDRLRGWGFECMCALCQAPKNETIASDKRLRRIKQLQDALSDFKAVRVTAETGAEYAALHEEEGLYAHLGSAYTRAALNAALFGDEALSREYARRAAEELALEKGPESGDARAMRALADDPRAHWTWGKRRKLDKKEG